MATIVVGIEDSLRGQDAVALAGDLARVTGAEVLAVCAFPYDDAAAAHYNPTMRAELYEAADSTLAQLCQPLAALRNVSRRAVADVAPARALLAAAAEVDAAIIVVGSSHAGFSGQVHAGSTGLRLLNGAPCAVAIAPQGYRLLPNFRGPRMSAAFDDSPTAHAALTAGAALAKAAGLALRVVSVFGPDIVTPARLHVPPGYLRAPHDAERAAREALERAVALVPGAQAIFVHGDPATELARESEASDLLVVGSRNYGPAPAVLLGEISGRLVETAACPVLVVPHGAEAPLGELCGELLTHAAA